MFKKLVLTSTLFLLSLFISDTAYAACSGQCVQVNDSLSTSTTMTLDIGASLASGNYVLLGIWTFETGAFIDSVTDSCGNTYTLAGTPIAGSNGQMHGYYAKITSAGDCLITVDFAGASSTALAEMTGMEVTGLDSDAGTVLDKYDGQHQGSVGGGGADEIRSTSQTTTTDGQFIFGATLRWNSTGTLSEGTGFSLGKSNGDIISEYLVQGSAGTAESTFTLTGAATANTDTILMTFKAASAGTPAFGQLRRRVQ